MPHDPSLDQWHMVAAPRDDVMTLLGNYEDLLRWAASCANGDEATLEPPFRSFTHVRAEEPDARAQGHIGENSVCPRRTLYIWFSNQWTKKKIHFQDGALMFPDPKNTGQNRVEHVLENHGDLIEWAFSCSIGDQASLKICINGRSYTHVCATREMKSSTRPRLLLFSNQFFKNTKQFLLKREDVTKDAILMKLLDKLNQRWAEYKVQCAGEQVRARTYAILPLSSNCGLVEFVPDSSTLDKLKRQSRSTKSKSRERVINYLSNADIDRNLRVLAASTVAYLVSNFLFGVGDGHGDNVMITKFGELFRIDFGFVFGERPRIDAPILWLPQAITLALGETWPTVIQTCQQALQIVAPWHKAKAHISAACAHDAQAFPERRKRMWQKDPYCLRMLVALDKIDRLMHTSALNYVIMSSGQDEFDNQLHSIDSSFWKGVKSVGHYHKMNIDYHTRTFREAHRAGSDAPAEGAPENSLRKRSVLDELESLFQAGDGELRNDAETVSQHVEQLMQEHANKPLGCLVM